MNSITFNMDTDCNPVARTPSSAMDVLLLRLALLVSPFILFGCNARREIEKFDVAFQWDFINFTWNSPEQLAGARRDGSYAPGNDVIAGIKIYKDVAYLALPRLKETSRVTLASLPLSSPKRNALLSPYPSWGMNLGDDCASLQNVLSMEIDTDGVMWVLDAKRDNNLTSCPPRVVLLDVENDGALVRSFEVPDELCPRDRGCFLNDIVVDGDFAYVSDTTKSDPGIFVYHRVSNQAWKFRDPAMHADPAAEHFTAQGVLKTGLEPINGIALSPNCRRNRTFYFMAQTGFNIHSISNVVLRNRTAAPTDVGAHITDHGKKVGQSGGMICDDEGYIYYGLLPLDAVGRWDTRKSLESAVVLDRNHEIIKWPDSFSFDDNGNLYLITNSILYFSVKGIDISDINFRVIKLHTGGRSYYYCKGRRD